MQHTRLLIAEVLGHRFGSADCVPGHGPGELANSDREGHQSANAHLISAAPELLTALVDLLAELGQHVGKRDVKKHYHLMVREEAARAAIAKATAE